MATTVQNSKLDFDNIKNSLKVYLAKQPEFEDYNFEASGLSNILDVLAYNTHYNALTANFALNESFLTTAQLRSSVVSHAATLGYVPRSRTASRAEIQLSMNLSGVANRPGSIVLGAGYTFTADADDVTYTFQTLEDYTATDNGEGFYQFLNGTAGTTIQIFEGVQKQKTFFVGDVGERQLYVMQDETIDTTTAAVYVYETPSSSLFTSYTPITTATSVNSQSRYYQISEAPNGFYELNFGDGISFGKSPEAGNKIVVTYLSCKGAAANNASTFAAGAQVAVPGVGNYPLSVATVASSGVGGARQSIESIRQNAPISFAAQQRLVTADDYRAVIQRNYPTVTDAIAWGGEDNVPADYGKVYVSLVFEDGTTESQKTAVENSIVQDVSNNLSILSIDTAFEDPVITYLEIILTFNFDPNLTGQTVKSTESSVFAELQSYVSTNLKQFGGIFRRSELLGQVDDISEAILNSQASVKLQQRFVPDLLQSTSYRIYFPAELSSPDPADYIVSSSTFIFNGKVCSIKNALNLTKLQIVNSIGEVEVDNVGSYEALTGTINLTGFAPTAITAGVNYIKLSVTPANQSTIRPLRSYILDLDEGPSFATSGVDRQQTDVTLGSATGVTSSSTGAANTYVRSPSIPSSGY
tara:strand:- start:5111 stop:7033 length:1923 start_codon:yes stop_codon:yes gene_type:complete